MNLLREYIRELLKESVDGKIMSMIDRAEEAGYTIRLFNAPGGGSVYLLPPEGWSSPADALGTVDWQRPSEKDHGPCMQAKNVAWSKAAGGFGPLLYDVAIEASSGLMPDRLEVSGEAEAVWQKYMTARPDIQVDQLDIQDDYFEPQITPDDPSDDCSQVPAHDKLKDKWHTSPLSKMYSKKGTPVIDELQRRGMLDNVGNPYK